MFGISESEGRKEIIPRNRSISVIQGSKYPVNN